MLQDAGMTRGVCTLSSYEIRTDGTPEAIVSKLTSSTDIVIMFLDADDVIEMLDAKQSVGGDADRLVFVVYDQYGELNISGSNAFTFRPDIASVPEFEAVLAGMSPNGTDSTAWFREYYESVYRCDLKNSFRLGTECDTSRPVTTSQYYHANVMVRNVMNAVYALTSAIDSLLQDRYVKYDRYCKYRLSMAVCRAMLFVEINLPHYKISLVQKYVRHLIFPRQIFAARMIFYGDIIYFLYKSVKSNTFV